MQLPKLGRYPPQKLLRKPGSSNTRLLAKKGGYGEFASLAATLPVPEEVALKDPKDFTLIGTSKKNVDLEKIISGTPLFGIDHQVEGMIMPPSFTHLPLA